MRLFFKAVHRHKELFTLLVNRSLFQETVPFLLTCSDLSLRAAERFGRLRAERAVAWRVGSAKVKAAILSPREILSVQIREKPPAKSLTVSKPPASRDGGKQKYGSPSERRCEPLRD
jgi:hypothetical protein